MPVVRFVRTRSICAAVVCSSILAAAGTTHAQLTTAFTYQGQLKDSGAPATGVYDMRFRLYDASAGGTLIGVEQCANNVTVTEGQFTVQVDFGAQFAGASRFLEIDVRTNGPGLTCAVLTGFTTLAVRQELTATPNAAFSLTAASAAAATNAANLNGQPASFYQNATNITAGIINDARIPGTVARQASNNSFTAPQSFMSSVNVSGISSFTGQTNFNAGTSGASPPFNVDSDFKVTNLNADLLDGFDGAVFPRLNASNTFTNGNTFTSTNLFSGNNGFGNASPAAPIDAASSTHNSTILSNNSVAGGHAVFGFASGSGGSALLGSTTHPSGYGVTATNLTTTGTALRLIANANGRALSAPNGDAYFGGSVGFGVSSPGYQVDADSSSDTRTISALNTFPGGTAVMGITGTSAGAGILGQSANLNGYGVRAENTASGVALYVPTGSVLINTATTLAGAVTVSGTSTFSGNATFNSPLTTLAGPVTVSGASTFSGTSTFTNQINVNNTAIFSGDARFIDPVGIGTTTQPLVSANIMASGANRTAVNAVSNGTDSTAVLVSASGTNSRAIRVSSGSVEIDAGLLLLGSTAVDGNYLADFNGTSGETLFRIRNNNAASNSSLSVASTTTTDWSTGVLAQTYGISSSKGVWGESNHATASGTYGVYGRNDSSSATSYGVYSSGNTGASGTKSFRIDHPDDPANRYLAHYSAESPDVLNMYTGNAMLDADGSVIIQLPAYFAKINTDPRYTLTAIGSPMPMLHIAEEISIESISAEGLCTFRIAGGAPNGKVTWRVEAIRNDLWVRTRGAPVEFEKPAEIKGRYQHPELYGQPASSSEDAPGRLKAGDN